MDPRTGELYDGPGLAELLRREEKGDEAAKATRERLVTLVGDEQSIRYIADAVKTQRRRENKAARKSRKKNRR